MVSPSDVGPLLYLFVLRVVCNDVSSKFNPTPHPLIHENAFKNIGEGRDFNDVSARAAWTSLRANDPFRDSSSPNRFNKHA